MSKCNMVAIIGNIYLTLCRDHLNLHLQEGGKKSGLLSWQTADQRVQSVISLGMFYVGGFC